jgi:sugar phosphate isomerase/epimerase
MPALNDIRIGTLASGNHENPAAYLRSLLPHGFESFSITFWQTLGGKDLARLGADVRAALDGSGAVVSSLGVFGNPLETGELDLETVRAWELVIDHAQDFGCAIVGGFAGRLRGKPIPASIPRFREVFGRLADRAARRGVRLAFENCAMGGDWQQGDWNIAQGPDAWELMFSALPAEHIGLEWEPCHQLVRLADPFAQLDDWHRRIFHLHGKDASIDRARLARWGIGSSREWAWHRTPGFGDSDWTAIISRLRMHGFTGSIDIEGWHDPVYRGDLEIEGQVHALHHLKRCRGGEPLAAATAPKLAAAAY